ncbi:MAG: hypothetical protein CO093_01425 [Alphaproteobacteria bacterium CG_4_9_14_3_um_filter_47_13]|nr:MAG: hypothetical protein CO093_01425 [Alphaproteobacteria bacterium CG_4_9_14_3_um_filter_47_13]
MPDMEEGISESRFYMWRAVFAMAHTDHEVTDAEKIFMNNYIVQVPFSEAQKEILREDMVVPQDVYDMFSIITEPEDQGQFFQFSRELVWCDGDLDAQEEAIKERLNAGQMDRVGRTQMENELHKSRAESKMWRTSENRNFEQNAENLLGFGSLLRKMIGGH